MSRRPIAGANARNEVSVAAQEIEFEISETQRDQCSIRPEIPELYFCPDMKGYGWCVRKKELSQYRLGRLDSHAVLNHLGEPQPAPVPRGVRRTSETPPRPANPRHFDLSSRGEATGV